MSWSARLKAALSGDVSGADVTAMLAATAPLAALEQELAGRRLGAELDHAGHEWRVCMALAPIAAPLWLGESLVTLAQSLLDAEAESHPDRPSDLSPLIHALVAAVLQPVEAIIAEVSAALVDPARPSGLAVPFTVGPRGTIAAYQLPYPIPAPYARGLLLAATRIEGAAQLVLDDTESLVTRSPAPGWLTAALQRVGGELRAASARLGMLETRLVPVLRAPRPDEQALAGICVDLWDALNTALVIGQMLREPHLLPGAPPPQPDASAQAMPASAPITPYVTRPRQPAPGPRAPVAPQRQQLPPALPRSAPDQASAFSLRPAAPERPLALPRIEEGARATESPIAHGQDHRPGTSNTPHPRETQPPALPHIGAAGQPSIRAPHHEEPSHAGHDEPAPFQLPHIGPEA